MSYAILCHLRPDSAHARRELRLAHLMYIQKHKDSILAGGPTLAADGSPETMILLTRFDEQGARAFIDAEPYTASNLVFASVEIHAWGRVLPEETVGALDDEIACEASART